MKKKNGVWPLVWQAGNPCIAAALIQDDVTQSFQLQPPDQWE
jgi:hypothetical protein